MLNVKQPQSCWMLKQPQTTTVTAIMIFNILRNVTICWPELCRPHRRWRAATAQWSTTWPRTRAMTCRRSEPSIPGWRPNQSWRTGTRRSRTHAVPRATWRPYGRETAPIPPSSPCSAGNDDGWGADAHDWSNGGDNGSDENAAPPPPPKKKN